MNQLVTIEGKLFNSLNILFIFNLILIFHRNSSDSGHNFTDEDQSSDMECLYFLCFSSKIICKGEKSGLFIHFFFN